MRVLIYEHVTASMATSLDSLRAEGRAMLEAVVEDFPRIPGVEVVTLASPNEAAFRDAAAGADYTLVIAPEIDGILATRCAWVEEAGGRLLGPSAQAVRLTGDKLLLGRHWLAHGVPTPPCRLHLPGEPPPSIFPAVCKPRFGAGSQATFLVHQESDIAAATEQARAEGCTDLLLQPFVPGQAVSVAWVLGPNHKVPLLPARQRVSDDGRFHYLGGSLPLDEELSERAVALSRRAVDCIPGLLGYVGVDLVLGDAQDGSADWAIELNPRLTTSYIGLRVLARVNLAQLMLQVVRREMLTPPAWHPGTVQFTAAGTIRRGGDG
jgi:tyramine---L-glutamate ligase